MRGAIMFMLSHGRLVIGVRREYAGEQAVESGESLLRLGPRTGHSVLRAPSTSERHES
jgi:hypothetical protein